jgi:hypothetical protein
MIRVINNLLRLIMFGVRHAVEQENAANRPMTNSLTSMACGAYE